MTSAMASLVPSSFSLPTLLLFSTIIFLLYTATIYTYRISFHPLSHIPGPKLAAATRWYEFYYDGYHLGQFFREIERMHRDYGPIVRISPNEVHVDDPAFFDVLYSPAKKLDKDEWYYTWLNRSGSVFSTCPSSIHKRRHAVLKRAFSGSSIAKIEEGLLKRHLSTFLGRLEECKQAEDVVPLSDAFRSLAVDIITDYAIPESHNLLARPDWGAAHASFVRGYTIFALCNRHLPFLSPVLEAVPRWVVKLGGDETVLNVVDEIEHEKEQARRVVAMGGMAKGKMDEGKEMQKGKGEERGFPVILEEVYNSELLPEDKTARRLFDEMGILIGAGSETVGHTFTTIAFHLFSRSSSSNLSNSDSSDANYIDEEKKEEQETPLAKLAAELRSHFTATEMRTGILSYKSLEKLPYLEAVISEGLRLATGVSGRLPRINHTEPTLYTDPTTGEEYVLPPGTSISMTIRDLHHNPTVFPSPKSFLPDRWIPDSALAKRIAREGYPPLEKYFRPFGLGTRSCVGRNLAMAELAMVVGNVVGRFGDGMEIVDEEGGRREVEMGIDAFMPFPVAGGGELRVRLG